MKSGWPEESEGLERELEWVATCPKDGGANKVK